MTLGNHIFLNFFAHIALDKYFTAAGRAAGATQSLKFLGESLQLLVRAVEIDDKSNSFAVAVFLVKHYFEVLLGSRSVHLRFIVRNGIRVDIKRGCKLVFPIKFNKTKFTIFLQR